MTNNSPDLIGKRVVVNDNIGTVRYVGPISNLEGIWYGIEWDDPSRGKHDGYVNGVRYFHAEHPKGGSFVRDKAVGFGEDILKCIQERFIEAGRTSDLLMKNENTEEFKIEIFGLEKLSSKLKSNVKFLSFSGEYVSSIKSPQATASLLQSVTTLDLRKSLLNNWDEIFELLNLLRSLNAVFLGCNRFSDYPHSNLLFPRIKTLSLSKISYDWDELRSVFIHFPNLEELDLTRNVIKYLKPLNIDLPMLKKLFLDYNEIEDWEEINKLQSLEYLHTLSVWNNPIKHIHIDKRENAFRSLRCLILSECPIEHWSSIDSLNSLPALEFLVLSNTRLKPVLKADIWTCIVARVPGLKFLNRTMISNQERVDCEKYLLTQTALMMRDENTSIEKSSDKRIQELLAAYGPVETGVRNRRPDWGFVRITIVDKVTGVTVDRRIPLSMTILLLETMIRHVLKIQRDKAIKLSHVDLHGIENALTKKRATIQFYEIADGERVAVQY